MKYENLNTEVVYILQFSAGVPFVFESRSRRAEEYYFVFLTRNRIVLHRDSNVSADRKIEFSTTFDIHIELATALFTTIGIDS